MNSNCVCVCVCVRLAITVAKWVYSTHSIQFMYYILHRTIVFELTSSSGVFASSCSFSSSLFNSLSCKNTSKTKLNVNESSNLNKWLWNKYLVVHWWRQIGGVLRTVCTYWPRHTNLSYTWRANYYENEKNTNFPRYWNINIICI